MSGAENCSSFMETPACRVHASKVCVKEGGAPGQQSRAEQTKCVVGRGITWGHRALSGHRTSPYTSHACRHCAMHAIHSVPQAALQCIGCAWAQPTGAPEPCCSAAIRLSGSVSSSAVHYCVQRVRCQHSVHARGARVTPTAVRRYYLKSY